MPDFMSRPAPPSLSSAVRSFISHPHFHGCVISTHFPTMEKGELDAAPNGKSEERNSSHLSSKDGIAEGQREASIEPKAQAPAVGEEKKSGRLGLRLYLMLAALTIVIFLVMLDTSRIATVSRPLQA